MKLTPSKRKFVLDKISHYSKLLHVEPPKVYFTMAEYDAWKATVRTERFERVGRSNALGVCHRSQGFVVILVKKAFNSARLNHTIAHEMIHFTKPGYSHGPEFEIAIKRLIDGKVTNGRLHG